MSQMSLNSSQEESTTEEEPVDELCWTDLNTCIIPPNFICDYVLYTMLEMVINDNCGITKYMLQWKSRDDDRPQVRVFKEIPGYTSTQVPQGATITSTPRCHGEFVYELGKTLILRKSKSNEHVYVRLWGKHDYLPVEDSEYQYSYFKCPDEP